MNNIDGEYIALGRQTTETGLSLSQFSATPGVGQNVGFNVTGSGIQENEYTDGFRMSVRSTQPMMINTNVVNGISSTMLAALQPGTQSVSKCKLTDLLGVDDTDNEQTTTATLSTPIWVASFQISTAWWLLFNCQVSLFDPLESGRVELTLL